MTASEKDAVVPQRIDAGEPRSICSVPEAVERTASTECPTEEDDAGQGALVQKLTFSASEIAGGASLVRRRNSSRVRRLLLILVHSVQLQRTAILDLRDA
jgi:hypothetical protein